jgi:hypothetical protein
MECLRSKKKVDTSVGRGTKMMAAFVDEDDLRKEGDGTIASPTFKFQKN